MNWKQIFRTLCPIFNAMPMKWFLCFGNLLTVVRDGGKFKENDDLDIGFYYDQFEFVYIKNVCEAHGWRVDRKILNDVDKKPLYLSLSPKEDIAKITGDFHLDLFAWYRYNGMYWHTYDVNMERPQNSIPSRYIFKGVPAYLLDELTHRDDIAGSGMHAWIPIKYGTLLDLWYPDWLHKRKEVSSDKYKIEIKSCKQFL